MSQCLIKVVVLKTSKVEAGHGACYLVTSCISLACISALKVSMFYEHSHFPVGNHHSQLFEGCYGNQNFSWDAKVWLWTSGSLSAGAEPMERQQDAQPLSHMKSWAGHLA